MHKWGQIPSNHSLYDKPFCNEISIPIANWAVFMPSNLTNKINKTDVQRKLGGTVVLSRTSQHEFNTTGK